ncbi:MAG: ABC transporter substrate-binding protein [Acidimicrobiales bacterium]
MSENYDRREFLAKAAKGGAAFTLLGAGGTLLDACGGNGTNTKQTTTTLKSSVAKQIGVNTPPKGAKFGGNITMGVEAEESGMDPTYAHYDSTGVMYARTIYDPLAMITFTGDVVPYLAESIVPNSTFTEWTITVRKGVTFHDGTPCDGAALAFCMEQFKLSGLTNFALTYWKSKGSVKQTGPYSCTIYMTDPWVAFPAWLAGYIGGQVAYMFSPTQYRKGESVLNTHPVGTGPFMFKQWDVNHFFATVRNPNYWRKDALGRQLPYVDSWTFKPLPDVAARYDALESGTIQMMHTDDDPTILLMETNKKIDYLLDNEVAIGEPDCNFGMINVADKTMKDIRLRQALAYGFSQAEYCTDIGRGLLTPVSGPFPAPSPYYSAVPYPQYDVGKAQALVASWSKDNGNAKPSIKYTTTTAPTSLTSASFVQQQYQAAGFDVTIEQVQQSALIDDALAGGYQVFAWRQFASIDPDLNYVFWSSTGGAIDFSRNDDPKIDSALDRARQTTDPSVRVAAYQEVAERFAVDLPYIWASRDVWSVAALKAVQNWNNSTTLDGKRGCPMLSGIIWPTEIWLDPA